MMVLRTEEKCEQELQTLTPDNAERGENSASH